MFPSPYGVIFILTEFYISIKNELLEFPSPYGVSFILTRIIELEQSILYLDSFRLLMELYSFLQ